MGFNGDLMEYNGIYWWINGDSMVIQWDLMVI